MNKPVQRSEVGTTTPVKAIPVDTSSARLEVLDGWRALSILLVLAAHMLPIGPRSWNLNGSCGFAGMALFFCLSGFLITQQLWRRHSVAGFLVRRLFRIVPLAYLGIAIVLVLTGVPPQRGITSLFFIQNYVHSDIIRALSHYWSLCVEMHFYAFAALLMLVTRFRGFAVLPVIWVGFTILRAIEHPVGGIETHFRIDELLAGAMLGLLHLGRGPQVLRRLILKVPLVVYIGLAVLTVLKPTVPIHFLRGTAMTLVVARTVLDPRPDAFRYLRGTVLRYLAQVSFAVYVFHRLSMIGWLGDDPNVWLRYLKRLGCFAITFGAAHLSTFWFEKWFIERGRAIARRLDGSG